MKRISALLLALTVLLTVLGCGTVSYAPSADASLNTPAQTPCSTPQPTYAFTKEPTSIPTVKPVPTPKPTPRPTSVPTPEPTPWPAKRHWWLFTPMGQGLSRGAGTFYNALWRNYLVYPQGGVVIGRIKGFDHVKVYTKDPEERVVWVPYSEEQPYRLNYSLSGMELPETTYWDNAICISDGEYAGGTLSERAKENLGVYIKRLEKQSEVLKPRGVELIGYISIAFNDLPGLGYLMPYRLAFTYSGEVFLEKYGMYGTINSIALDADDMIATEYIGFLAQAEEQQPEFTFFQMIIRPEDVPAATTAPQHLRSGIRQP